jgi:UDP-hydrolysing UDP-N-acetyl-D-glucosamine 2-epimerase
MKKKICVFLGSRANYSSLKPIMREIKNDEELELILFAGASALLDKYGEVAETVANDGFKIDEYIYMQVEGGGLATMAKSTGLGLIEIPGLLFKHKPDYTFIVGDRHEMLSMAVASALMNIPIAHSMGGEITGTIDESIRHAITKLAHLHFAANEKAKENIIRLGENPEHVFNFGCPRNDYVKEVAEKFMDKEVNDFLHKEGVGAQFNLNGRFMLISQHPVTTEFGSGEAHIMETLHAVKSVNQEYEMPVIVLWPNADAGGDDVSRGIRKFRENNRELPFRYIKNLPLEIYIQLMKRVTCLVGNSSSGIREGALLGTPVVNVGSRQQGRDQAANVTNTEHDHDQIAIAIKKHLANGRYEPNYLYGDGNASQKIVNTLKTVQVSPQKRLCY